MKRRPAFWTPQRESDENSGSQPKATLRIPDWARANNGGPEKGESIYPQGGLSKKEKITARQQGLLYHLASQQAFMTPISRGGKRPLEGRTNFMR